MGNIAYKWCNIHAGHNYDTTLFYRCNIHAGHNYDTTLFYRCSHVFGQAFVLSDDTYALNTVKDMVTFVILALTRYFTIHKAHTDESRD